MSFSDVFQNGTIAFLLSIPLGLFLGLVFGFFKRLRTFVGSERFITGSVPVAVAFGVIVGVNM